MLPDHVGGWGGGGAGDGRGVDRAGWTTSVEGDGVWEAIYNKDIPNNDFRSCIFRPNLVYKSCYSPIFLLLAHFFLFFLERYDSNRRRFLLPGSKLGTVDWCTSPVEQVEVEISIALTEQLILEEQVVLHQG